MSFGAHPLELVHQVLTLRQAPPAEHWKPGMQFASLPQRSPSLASGAQTPRLQDGATHGHSTSTLQAIAGGGSGRAQVQCLSSQTRSARHGSNAHDSPSPRPAMVGCASVSVSRSRVSAPRATPLHAIMPTQNIAIAPLMRDAMCRRHATRRPLKKADSVRGEPRAQREGVLVAVHATVRAVSRTDRVTSGRAARTSRRCS